MKYREVIYLILIFILTIMICINQERIETLEKQIQEQQQTLKDYNDRYERMIKYNEWLIGG